MGNLKWAELLKTNQRQVCIRNIKYQERTIAKNSNGNETIIVSIFAIHYSPLENKQTITNMDSDEVKLDELCMIMGVHNMQEIKLH